YTEVVVQDFLTLRRLECLVTLRGLMHRREKALQSTQPSVHRHASDTKPGEILILVEQRASAFLRTQLNQGPIARTNSNKKKTETHPRVQKTFAQPELSAGCDGFFLW